jgi:hypothetical protein
VQAPVEIRYEGAVLAKAVAPSGSLEEGGTLFLPLPDPMPVGTRLELWSASETTLVRVVKVTESPDAAAAGVSVRHINIAEPVEIFDPEPSVPTSVPTPVAASATAPAPTAPRAAPVAAPAPTPAAPAPRAELPEPVPAAVNGANRSAPVTVSGTIDNPAVTSTSGVIGEPMDAGESVEVEDTSSTSEYPALPNGVGTKRRKKARKPQR